jgi:predicted dehydrogenase
MVIHGNAGYLSSDNFVPRNIYSYAVKEGTKNILRRAVGRKIRPLSFSYYYEMHYKELKHFFECVTHDLNPRASATDGLKIIELIEETYKAQNNTLSAEKEL